MKRRNFYKIQPSHKVREAYTPWGNPRIIQNREFGALQRPSLLNK